MTRFGLLGPLVVTDSGGNVLRLRSERQRALLAVLLCHANEPVRTDLLVETLWPERPPKSYASNLHTYLSRLRDRLPGLEIDHVADGYGMCVSSDDVDALVFTTSLASARDAAGSGDLLGAATRFRRALELWRGPALADVHVPTLYPVLSKWEQERLTATEEWAEAALALGAHAEVITELRPFLTRNPLRERAAALLMVALLRAGRQAEALAVYTATRSTLVRELGVEPTEELRRTHAAVLRGEDIGPAPISLSAVVRAPTPWPVRQLPADVVGFTGRDRELGELVAALSGSVSVPVVVVSGAPGVGKSALALRAAHEVAGDFPDGHLYVHLTGVSTPQDPGAALADVLRALGVAGPLIPDDVHARAALLRATLAGRRVLVVLDDAASAEQVHPLLPGTPGCAVLVTSRRRLSGLAATHRLTVAPMTDEEALTLLGDLVGSGRMHADPAAAHRIVTACGRLPLALRIAGTRLVRRPELPLRHLADRLDDQRTRLRELALSDRDVAGSIAISYDSLDTRSRWALRGFALCGDVSIPGWVAEVLVGEDDVDQVIDELVEASLLTSTGTDGTGEPRYRLHALIRVFAQAHSDASRTPGEQLAALRRITDAAIGLADAAARQLPWTLPLPALTGEDPPPPQPLPRATVARLVDDPHVWFETERNNLVAVMGSIFRIGWRREAMLLLERLTTFLWLQGAFADLRECHDTMRRAAVDAGEPEIAAWSAAYLATLAHARGEHAEAVRRYRAVVTELADAGRTRETGWLIANLGTCLIGLGNPAEGLAEIERAASLLDDDPAGLHQCDTARSYALTRLGRLDDALDSSRRALARGRMCGDPVRVALSLDGLAWNLALDGDWQHAGELADEAVSLARTLPVPSLLARSLRTLGAVAAGKGARAEAVAAYTEAHDIARRLGERPRELSCLRALASAWIGDGRAAEAVVALRRCLSEFESMGSVASTAITWRVLARAHEAAGDLASAEHADTEANRLLNPDDRGAARLISALLVLTRDAGHASAYPASPPVSGCS
ncbi:AfsR/SARP family transcriptional regulator [Saccharomonospora xinjiangensis]|uniref:AfsR/SARP family transcriptional regulator n=1 Tax=Saccharomonospora xinjiangensis TaxID=75294 RepID=UPI00106F1125|nr:AfsR/SARP family transcriptional regulator [Saccharomonospora xinjiangensis]QBQ61784.1 Regulatory protein AfsR [Saccharomonospora xinjiangensis]